MKSGMIKNGLLIIGMIVGFLYAAQDAEIKQREADNDRGLGDNPKTDLGRLLQDYLPGDLSPIISDYAHPKWTIPGLRDGGEIEEERLGVSHVNRLTISKNNKQITALHNNDNQVSILDAQTGALLKNLRVYKEFSDRGLSRGQLTSNNAYIIYNDGIYHLNTGKQHKKFVPCPGSYCGATGESNATALSKDESLFAAAYKDLCIWNTETGEVHRKLSRDANNNDSIREIVISADKAYAVCAHEDGMVCVWDIITGTLKVSRNLGRSVSGLALSSDNRYVVLGDDNGKKGVDNLGRVVILDIQHPDNILSVEGFFGGVISLAIGGDSSFVVAAVRDVQESDKDQVCIWDIHNGKSSNILRSEYSISALVISDDDTTIAVGSSGRDKGTLWRLINPAKRSKSRRQEASKKRSVA